MFISQVCLQVTQLCAAEVAQLTPVRLDIFMLHHEQTQVFAITAHESAEEVA